MSNKFLELAVTESVRAAQEQYYGNARSAPVDAPEDRLSREEIEFIGLRDSFYLATITENGWPYIQHRGGSPGFLKVLNEQTLAFADYRGNRQMLSTGNLAANDRVALFLMDYPHRARLKILGRGRVEEASLHPELTSRLAEADVRRIVERVFFIDVVAFDWNCPQYITPRYSSDEIRGIIEPLHRRIAELEAQLQN